MPIIEISQSEFDQSLHDKDLEAALWRRVLGAMLYPLNETERASAELAMFVRYMDRRLERQPADEIHELTTKYLRGLIKGAKALPNFIEQEMQRATYAARAGHVLRTYLQDHFAGRKPQLDRAKSLVAENTGVKKSHIETNSWTEYRFVSHFWAAALLLAKPTADLPVDFPESDMAGVPLPQFLATAETLRKYGEARLAGRPALDQPERNWALPTTLEFGIDCHLYVGHGSAPAGL